MTNTTLTKPKGQNMKAYKGFNKDMTCRGFQYKEGGEYETDKADTWYTLRDGKVKEARDGE